MVVVATVTGFQGLSTDAKPTTGISLGASFVETDTNKNYTWNGIAWTLGSGMSEVQFLAGQAAAGKLITASGSVAAPAANAVIASYTPANGTTFILYEATCNVNAQPTAGTTAGVNLRNNGTVKGQVGCQYSTLAGLNSAQQQFPVKGDQLIGDGVKVYDIINVNAITAGTIYGSICGYLL